eukprot:scaffold6380_cov17-Prasinocladus_malaysianus.AAC.1
MTEKVDSGLQGAQETTRQTHQAGLLASALRLGCEACCCHVRSCYASSDTSQRSHGRRLPEIIEGTPTSRRSEAVMYSVHKYIARMYGQLGLTNMPTSTANC